MTKRHVLRKENDVEGNEKNGFPPVESVCKDGYIVDVVTDVSYFKGEQLGKGGFGEVYRIVEAKSKEEFACKIVSKSALKERQLKKVRFEVSIHAELRHVNVVKFYKWLEDDRNLYIVIEYCAKKSLFEVLKKRKRLTEPEVRYYMRQLSSGVRYIHEQGIVHRDLKPGNLFLSSKMELKIGDFGLALAIPPVTITKEGAKDNAGREASSRRAPEPPYFCGTPNYVAPEVISSHHYGYECDIWAVGCIMYTLLVGRPPFQSNSVKSTFMRIKFNVYNFPSHLSYFARSLIASILKHRPQDRPALAQILQHPFFIAGFVPENLSPEFCIKAPKFSAASLITRPLPALPTKKTKIVLRIFNPHESITKVASSKKIGKCGKQQVANENTSFSAHKDNETQKKPKVQVGLPYFWKNMFIPKLSRNFIDPKHENPNPTVQRLPATRTPALGRSRSNCDTDKHGSLCCLSANDHTVNYSSRQAVKALIKDIRRIRLSDANPLSPTLVSDEITDIRINYVTKWIDYTNRYGFCFMLSSGCLGIEFNDGVRLAVSEDQSRVYEIICGHGTSAGPSVKLETHSYDQLPSRLEHHFDVIRYFRKYMEENLLDAVIWDTVRRAELGATKQSKSNNEIIPYMCRWERTSETICLHLSDGTVQVNNLKDHTKIVLKVRAPPSSCEQNTEESTRTIVVLFIDSDKSMSICTLRDIRRLGCKAKLLNGLKHVCDFLQGMLKTKSKIRSANSVEVAASCRFLDQHFLHSNVEEEKSDE